MPKSSVFWLWMLKVAAGTPKHPPAEQLSHPAGQRLLPVLLRAQPQHRAALGRGKRERVEQSRAWGACAASEREQHRGSSRAGIS